MVESLKVVKLIEDCKDLVPESGLPDITLAREIVECMKGVSLEDLIQARDDYAVRQEMLYHFVKKLYKST